MLIFEVNKYTAPWFPKCASRTWKEVVLVHSSTLDSQWDWDLLGQDMNIYSNG